MIAGLVILGLGTLFLQSLVSEWMNSERPARSTNGWTWFWFIGGSLVVMLGAYIILQAEKLAERSHELRKQRLLPIIHPVSKRGQIVLGAFNLLLGASWVVGSWPF